MTKASAVKQEPELFDATSGAKRPKTAAKPKPPTTGSGVKPAPAKKQDLVVHQVQPLAQPKSLLQVIAEAASNPAVDVQKMKELLAIQKDMEAREAEREFTIALAAAQAEMPRIARDTPGDKHKYARLETVTKKLDPIIAKHNFSLSFGMADSPIADHYRITALLAHKGGHKREYFIDLPSDTSGARGAANKTPVQGIGSTISYGRRYLTVLIFNIAITNEDDDGQGGRVDKITEEQADELLRMCADKNIGAALFSRAFGVVSFADLPARRFEEAKSRLTLAPAQQAKPKQQEQNHEAE